MTDWFHIQSLIHAILINESLCIRSDFIGSYNNVLSQWQLRSLSTRIRSPCWKEKPPTFKDGRFNSFAPFLIFSPFFLFLFLFLLLFPIQPETKERNVPRSSIPANSRIETIRITVPSKKSTPCETWNVARFEVCSSLPSVQFLVSVHVTFLPRRKLGRNFVEANKVAGLDKNE